MSVDMSTFVTLLQRTIFDPRAVARDLIALNLSRQVLWQLLLLVVAISVIAAYINGLLVPPPPDIPVEDYITPSPFALVMLLGVTMLGALFGGYYVGRAFGGHARFEHVLVLVTWTQAVLLVVQVFQTAILLVSTNIALTIGYAGPVLLLWMLTNFLTEAHGFRSRALVFGGIFGTMFAAIFAILLVLQMFGITFVAGV